MPCERCGGDLETYKLNGRDARACRECGYLDVPVEHEPDFERSESWHEAMSRFYEKHEEITVPDELSVTVSESPATDD